MIRPGPKNCICDVEGIRVGQVEDADLVTGVTVVVPERPAVAAVDVRGGGPATRAVSGLAPSGMVTHVHAVCLSGGSSFGLDAAGGVMDGLRRREVGFRMGSALVPIVPGAIIFDLMTGGPKDWEPDLYHLMGSEALEAADTEVRLGNAGAGMGATAGPIKGGTGTASYVAEWTVGALAIANPVGSVVMPGTTAFWAWWLEENGEFGGQQPARPADLHTPPEGSPLANTTLAVVATNATLTRDEALRVAIMAQDGLARAIRPVHTPLDGDTVFVLSTAAEPGPATPAALARLGGLAADAVARAVCRGVYHARPLAGVPAYADLPAPG